MFFVDITSCAVLSVLEINEHKLELLPKSIVYQNLWVGDFYALLLSEFKVLHIVMVSFFLHCR